MEDDLTYYGRRAEAERRAADLAGDAETRRLHLELAELLSVKSVPRRSRRSAAVSPGRISLR
jgi:hypothetical protein